MHIFINLGGISDRLLIKTLKMKTLYYYFLSICFVTSLISCNPEQSTDPNAEGSPRAVSDSYMPPVFASDDRVEKIKNIQSEIELLVEEHAKDKNIPGIAYGIVVDHELVIASATGMISLGT